LQYRANETDDGAIERTSSRVAHLANAFKVNKAAWVIVVALFLVSLEAYFGYRRYKMKTSGTAIRSIAVLPFQNLTNNPESDYLSDGISESLINHLSQVPSLKVSARRSSFKYKGNGVYLPEAAQLSAFDALLTGRILQRGDDLVISVELMDARDETQLWGEQYNRKLADVSITGAPC
jgi:TolB-like protein